MADLASLPVRAVLLVAAILVYAGFGSPTPDNPGWPEMTVGLLLFAAGAASIPSAFSPRGEQGFLKLLMLYGLSVPLLVGVISGYELAALARDIIPFLFLCLPLFLASVVGKDERSFSFIVGSIIVLGIVFALRALGPAYGWLEPSGELYYLSNSPTVLFAAIIMAGVMVDRLALPLQPARLAIGLGAMTGMMVILWAMLLDTQRATIMAIILSFLLLLLLSARRGIGRVIPIMVLITVIAFCFIPVFFEAADAMARKTAKVGLNMRLEEARAVIDTIGASWHSALFGIGWGAKMPSPAVADIDVAFTHSLLSYLLLKTGLCGFILTLAWLVRLAWDGLSILRERPAYGLGLFWALLIPVFFYASHKSLDFGLILVLAAVLADRCHGRVATAKPGV